MHHSKYLRRFSFGSEVCSITPSSFCSLPAGHGCSVLSWYPAKRYLRSCWGFYRDTAICPTATNWFWCWGKQFLATAQVICKTPDVAIKCTNSVPSPELTKQKLFPLCFQVPGRVDSGCRGSWVLQRQESPAEGSQEQRRSWDTCSAQARHCPADSQLHTPCTSLQS